MVRQILGLHDQMVAGEFDHNAVRHEPFLGHNISGSIVITLAQPSGCIVCKRSFKPVSKEEQAISVGVIKRIGNLAITSTGVVKPFL